MGNISVNNSLFSIDRIFQEYSWLSSVSINGYPVLMMVWNLFLILIPLAVALLLYRYYNKNKFRKKRQKVVALILFLVWILFIPNTAYIMTDIRNLLDYCPVSSYKNVCLANAWMIIIFFGYAVVGWMSFVLLVNQMRRFFQRLYNRETALLFVIVLIPLVALGVLLGLMERFNSWSVATQPVNVLEAVKDYFTGWIYAKNWLIFTAAFYILYFLGNRFFKKF